MHFMIYCTDKPGSFDLRTTNRKKHLDFLEKNKNNIFVVGPTLTEDGEGMNGSLLIVDFPDRAAVNAFVDADPYTSAGLFESVNIKRWKMVFEPNALSL